MERNSLAGGIPRAILELLFSLSFLVTPQLAYSSSCISANALPVASSKSGEYTLIRLVENGSTTYELLREGHEKISFVHSFKNLRTQFLLDDGTFVGIEGGSCGGDSSKMRLHVISANGEVLYSSVAKDIVNDAYLEQVANSTFGLGETLPWMYEMNVTGNSYQNAIATIGLANYDNVEIDLDTQRSKYIAINDLGDDVKGWLRRAQWYGYIKQHLKELAHYSGALNVDPKNSQARYFLIQHHRRQGDSAKTQALIEEALQLEPLENSDLRESDSFDRKTNHVGNPLFYQFMLAELFKKTKQTNKAITAIDKILEINPQQWRSNLLKADLQLKLENRIQWRQRLKEIVDYHVDYIEKSNEDSISKEIVSEEYRKSYAVWLSKNQFYDEAEEVYLSAYNDITHERGYYQSVKHDFLSALADNAKKKNDPESELNYQLLAASNATSHYDIEKLAWRFVRGDGVKKDYKKAVSWFQKAVDLEYSRADYFPICYLTYVNELGRSDSKSTAHSAWKKAEPWCQKGTDKKQGDSAFWLAFIKLTEKKYHRKRVSQLDLENFDSLLTLARKKHYPMTSYSDVIDFDIQELSDELAKFIPALKRIAEQGSVMAAFYLGNFYQHGIAVNKDDQRSTKWFKRASQAGDPESQFHYARKLVYIDTLAAIELMELATEKGHWRAARELGTLYFKGIWVERDLKKMEHWLLLADSLIRQQTPSYYSSSNPTRAKKLLNEYQSSL